MSRQRFQKPPFFQNVTILGVGLIGASFAMAMKKNRLCKKIVGYGRNPQNLERAVDKKIIDSFSLDPAHASRGADLVLFATPVGIFTDLAAHIKGSLKKNALITDVGSVKGKLVHDLEKIMPETACFVGGHPIAGSDRSGIDKSSPGIFHRAKCILTPTARTDKKGLQTVIDIWKIFGSHVEVLDPEEHDKIYALVSHFPHLVAYEIVNTVADIESAYLRFSGKGFKDATRIASSAPELWRDICLLNRDNLLECIEIFKKNLDRVSQYLRANNSGSLEKDFQKARTLRESIGQN
jgi:prephenate dehydrogenase